MTVSLARNGAGLGAAWGEERALEVLRDAGWQRFEVHKPEHDYVNNYYVMHKQSPPQAFRDKTTDRPGLTLHPLNLGG